MTVVAFVAHVLNTPIPHLLDMDVDDFFAFHKQALAIAKARKL